MELKEIISEDGFALLASMAGEIWHETYKDILPERQIAFLLERYFSSEGLRKYIAEGNRYFFIAENGVNAGFMAYRENGDSLYLDKLYILKSHRRRGLATACFRLLASEGKDVTLNVNRRNKRAIAAYLASGFRLEKAETISLSGGLINEDYVMRLKA